MDYLNKQILNTWKNIPGDFKDRVNNLEVITKPENKNNLSRLIELVKDREGTYRIVIYTNPLKQKFQKDINKLIITELALVFGFDENEAYELMGKKM